MAYDCPAEISPLPLLHDLYYEIVNGAPVLVSA